MTPRRSTAALPKDVDTALKKAVKKSDGQYRKETRNVYIKMLHNSGWSPKSIADSSGLTVQRIGQIVKSCDLSVELSPEQFPVPRSPKNRSVTLSWTNKNGLGGLYSRKTTLEMAISQIESSTMLETLWWIDSQPATTKNQRDQL